MKPKHRDFAQDEIEVSLALSLFATFLRHWVPVEEEKERREGHGEEGREREGSGGREEYVKEEGERERWV